MDGKVTNAQIAKIWACAHDIGLDTTLLHLLVPRGSIRAMTRAEGSELIEHLIELGARQVGPRLDAPATHQTGVENTAPPDPAAATPEQLHFIHFLLGRLGWVRQPERTRGFLMKYAGAATVEEITDKARASAIIEALKAIHKRQQKAENNGFHAKAQRRKERKTEMEAL
jgi:hypothetical protein